MSLARRLFPVALVLSLAACGERGPTSGAPPADADPQPTADGDAPRAPLETIDFVCGDKAVRARFFAEGLELEIDGETIALSEVVAASGARYASGSDPAEVEFWSKGREALLSLRGTRHPTCRRADDSTPEATRYRAVGQEPGWSLGWWGEGLALVFADENARIEASAVERIDAEGGFILEAQTTRGALRMIVEQNRLCRDSMSGMPHPDSVRLHFESRTLDGCGGDPKALLEGVVWRVERLDGETVLDTPEVTLHVLADAQVAGRAGCNRYSAAFHVGGEGVTIGPVIATKMACMDEHVMEQEARFLDLLGKAVRFDVGDDGRLRMTTADGRSLEARRESGD